MGAGVAQRHRSEPERTASERAASERTASERAASERAARERAARERAGRSARDKRLGRAGEDLAAAYLQQQGLVVLSRNWRCRDGELDLVATDRTRLVVCEVKTRSGTGFGAPIESVTPDKAHRIRRLANAWLMRYAVGQCEVRFDVISVLWPRGGEPTLQHHPGVF